MKTFTNWMTSSSWTESLGWALLHSLWQSLAILMIVVVLFRFMPKRDAVTRYVIATSGLMAMLVSAIGTFLYLFLSSGHAAPADVAMDKVSHQITLTGIISNNTFDLFFVSIQQNIHWMTLCWMAGTLLFTLRLAGSWWYVTSLRTHASVIEGTWHNRLLELTRELKVRFIPVLAESTRVTAPVVVGYLKPVILLPIGMISGLRTEQIEAILLHELTHIKRHDYIVNILQALIETILFFNPFVWMTSSIIRREREHCCDDAVIRYSNPRTYATALAQLEEIRLTKSGLALSLAENENQLLNRIKRIMENSVKNYSSREKMIPVLLLITGLVCASWITLQSQEPSKQKQETKVVPADTTKKKSTTRTFRYKTVTTTDENGKPKEEVVQYYDSDDSNHDLFVMPPVPPVDFVPPVPHVDFVAPMANFDFPIPAIADGKDWEAFGKEFEAHFKEQFADFYEDHQEEFEAMMKDVENNFQNKFDEQWEHQFELSVIAKEDAMRAQAEAMENNREAMDMQRDALKEIERDMAVWQKDHEVQMKEMEANLKKMEENMRQFEKELQEELIKDGYLKKGEKIDNIHWESNGKIEVNDVKIKDSDLPKYQKLHDKYFKEDGDFHYVR